MLVVYALFLTEWNQQAINSKRTDMKIKKVNEQKNFCFQLAKKIREKFNRYLDVVNRNKQVVEASYTAHLTSPLTAIQDCCTIPPSMME